MHPPHGHSSDTTFSAAQITKHSLEMPSQPGRHLWPAHQTCGISVLLQNRFEHLLHVPSLPQPAGSYGIFPSAPWQDLAACRESATALWNILTDAFKAFEVWWGLVRWCCLFFLCFINPDLICYGSKDQESRSNTSGLPNTGTELCQAGLRKVLGG